MPSREFVVTVGEREHRVVVAVDRHGSVQSKAILVDGIPHQLVPLDQAGSVLVRPNGTTSQVRVTLDREPIAEEAWTNAGTVRLTVCSAQDAILEAAAGGRAAGAGEVRAPMPGQVVKVLVAEGQRVDTDDTLIIVEAMKMENELRSPRAGTVSGLTVAPGQVLEADHVVCQIVEHEDGSG